MIKEIELTVSPDHINDSDYINKAAGKKLHLNPDELYTVVISKKSLDARKKEVVYRIKAAVYINEPVTDKFKPIKLKSLTNNKQVVVVGGGPSGMFAAIKLIELNIKPVIVERGKDVRSRRRDIKAIMRDHIVNPDSNYCFGEGGAGTYSDGKLYTRSTKRGDVKRILNLLYQHGAADDILTDAHPHIGSNKLPKIVEAIRNTILESGGEYLFESRLTDLLIGNDRVRGVIINDQKELHADGVILATGHSARDIYYLLERKGIKIEAKSFAMGVRIEHPQILIDEIQYHSATRHPNLPASSYNISCRVDDRGVYSFCMCPGGIIVPASTAPGELVLNGMSVSKRNSKFANAGLVVTINENDWQKYKKHGPLAGLEYQKHLERIAFEEGGCSQRAPAQRVTDFVNRRDSRSLPDTSYVPGTVIAPLHEILPKQIARGLGISLKHFGKQMHGYLTEEAQILAAETRTSSPVRIPRDPESLMHIEIKGLFPAGEGAGYAGGIISAAIDGERCAEAAYKYLNKN
ncbi:MAG: FAD-dependent oxidoreductase [Melioribacteraceae bacterium]|nr:FAD-dependent oxidoreductase [Melioribacteraceae bacterium]